MAEGVRKINEWVMSAGRTLIVTDPAVSPGSVPEGTLLIDAEDGTFKVRLSGSAVWNNLTPQNLFLQKSITTAYLADRSITDAKIALATVATENLKDALVTGPKLAADSVSDVKLMTGAVTNTKLGPLSVTEDKIADLALSSAKIQDNAVTNTKIVNSAVTSLKIADASVTEVKIVNGSVTNTKLGDLSISTVKIQDSAITTVKIATLSIDSTRLADNAVVAAKIANLNVTTAKIADLNITGIKIADSAITETKIADGAVIASKIRDGHVTSSKIAEGNVSISKLDVSTQNLITGAIRVVNGTATVAGGLYVNGPITATGNITGAKVYNAVYNDLAEAFEPGEDDLEEGDIVEVDELGKVFRARAGSRAVIGVVSERFAMLFGGEPEDIESGEKVAVGLIGQVPVKVIGHVRLGDYIVSAGGGKGIANNDAPRHLVVGKAIESKYTHEEGRVLCLIFPA